MGVTDPRKHYDDLIELVVEDEKGPDEFAVARENEAFDAGWVGVGVVLDDVGRVLLAYNAEEGVWVAPGGARLGDESLRETVVREVREETGVDAVPRRPHAVCDVVARHDSSSLSFTIVTFEANAESTVIGEELGEEDEPITTARWFDELPEPVFARDVTERVLERCRDGRQG